MPGAPELEDAWIRVRLGEPAYLAGQDAEVAACDALTVPVVTGHTDVSVIDKIIALAAATPGGTAEAPHQAQEGRRRDIAAQPRALLPVPPRDLHPPLGLAGDPPP
jgi:uncharacterized protein YjlB